MRTIGQLAMLFSLATSCVFNTAGEEPPPVLDTVPSQALERVVLEPRPGTCDFRGATISGESRRCAPEATRFYVVTEVLYPDIDIVGERERVLGLDLDGVHTTLEDADDETGCGVPDSFSPDGSFHGVDNMAAVMRPTFDVALASGGLDASARVSIAEGRFGAVVELRNYNGGPADACVDVFVYDALLEAPELDAAGRLRVDQPVVLSSEPRGFINGTVLGGELRADLGGFPIPQPFMADLHNAHIRLALTDTAFTGLLVGELPVETGIASLTCRGEDDLPPEVIRTTAESIADLHPGPDGCTGLSWGVSIQGVRAMVE